MLTWSKFVIAVFACLALVAAAAVASSYFGWWGNGPSGGAGGSVGAPAPIAGAGLPLILIAGGYLVYRRYRHRQTGK